MNLTTTISSMILAASLAIGASGCLGGVEEVDGESEELVEEHELAIGSASNDGSCYYSGGTRWCQDAYSRRWCTNSEWGQGWDYTGCGWSGWNGDRWCDDGWLWGPAHRHCPN